ncbi:AAA family ATPase [Actinomadura decatromicini]|uniref:AAA family ATPase n=1 Tax=Actinomadura decatromicini TaxID=2604572 RepID=A0A5D3FTU4_9ACTN|nr:AAA family ATPase [Actinomadura decatromicini]TYK51428.1 AAA family ATPase [Actinomadura decatromicini]
MRGEVVILTGPPGAGKSTTAAALAAGFEKSVHLHTDDFWHFIAAGAVPPYLPESDRQNQTVLRVIALAALAYAEGGYTVVVDGIIGPWMLHHFQRAKRDDPAMSMHYMSMHYIVLRPARETTLARAQARTGPDALTAAEPVLAMWDQFADLADLEGHVLDTGDQSPDQTLEVVREALKSENFRLP